MFMSETFESSLTFAVRSHRAYAHIARLFAFETSVLGVSLHFSGVILRALPRDPLGPDLRQNQFGF
jgi:hypothetical protein